MIALYSFKKFKHFKPFDKVFFQIAHISVELAKKYMKTKLISDEEGRKLFTDAGIIFDEYSISENITRYKGDRYCMPKIYAMIEESDPYVHLDFDTFIFKKPTSTLPVAFANPEVPIDRLNTYKEIAYVYKTYVESYETKFYPRLPKSVDHELKWDLFPSNSILLVNNPEIVKLLYTEIIEDFIPQEIFEDMNPSFIEQFCLVNFLRKYKIEFEFLKPEPTFDIFLYGEVSDKVKDRLHIGRDFLHLGRYDWYPKAIQYLLKYIYSAYNIKEKNLLL